MDERVDGLLTGAVDVHMHTAPDIFKRSVTDLEAGLQAKEAGMAAILTKSHHTMTADRAATASAQSGFPVFGSLTLNYYVGGFNPLAVEAALKFGAKEIWMPTINSRYFLEGRRSVVHFHGELPEGVPGLAIWDDQGNIHPEVNTILEMIAEKDVILGTAHLSIPEQKVLVRRAKEIGVSKIAITHPEADFIDMSIEDMKEFADLGGLLEFHYAMMTPSLAKRSEPEFVARAIREVGPERCILATDGGQAANPPPVEMMRTFIDIMLGQGLSEADIRTMVSTNPKRLLSI